MNPQIITSELEAYNHDTDHLLGTFSKIIGSSPDYQATAVVMVFEKHWVKTIEKAYALWLIDALNATTYASASIRTYTDHPDLKIPELREPNKPVGDTVDWKLIQSLMVSLGEEGVHIPSKFLKSDTLQPDSVRQAFGFGNGSLDGAAIIEIEDAFIVMGWETLA